MPLPDVVEEIREELKACHRIHWLRVLMRLIENTSRDIERVMDPVRRYRAIKTMIEVHAMRGDLYTYWSLKHAY